MPRVRGPTVSAIGYGVCYQCGEPMTKTVIDFRYGEKFEGYFCSPLSVMDVRRNASSVGQPVRPVGSGPMGGRRRQWRLMDFDKQNWMCRDCGQRLSNKTSDEFYGHPGDYAHRTYACLPRIRDQRDATDVALWAVVDGIARGWRAEDRIVTYEAVAKALGGRYVTQPGSLCGEFVDLRARPTK